MRMPRYANDDNLTVNGWQHRPHLINLESSQKLLCNLCQRVFSPHPQRVPRLSECLAVVSLRDIRRRQNGIFISHLFSVMIYFEKRKCEIFSFRHHQRRQNGFLRALINAATATVNGHKGFIEFRWWCFRLANVARFYFRSSIRFHFGAFLQSFQGKVKERSRNYILICCERSLTRGECRVAKPDSQTVFSTKL